jgi:hypothetical protein
MPLAGLLPRPAAPPKFLGQAFRATSPSITFDLFFDRPSVVSKMDDYRRRVLIRQGGFARRTMRNGMRPGGKKGASSRPGEFPRAQEGSLKRLTFFAYDQQTDSAVVGPIKFNRLPRGYSLEGGVQTIPELLNEGGVAVYDPDEGERSRGERFTRSRERRGYKSDSRQSAGGGAGKSRGGTAKSKRRSGGVARRTKNRRYTIAARPFVRLTNEIVAPRLADLAAQVPFA